MIPCKCTCGWPVYTPIAIAIQCPRCRAEIICDGEQVSQKKTPPSGSHQVERGNHWLTLHNFAYSIDDWLQSHADVFVKQWVADIERFTPRSCGCASAWQAFNYQFDTSSREAFQRSCVDGHNLVRSKLKQPLFTYEQAHRLWTGPRVGFLADSYSIVGGTETFHRALLPRLRERLNIVGFVATRHHTGNPATLKVPYSTGINAAKKLASECDILVSWAVPLAKVLGNGIRPKVVAVHHGDPEQSWAYIEENLRWTDAIVGVNPNITNRFPEAAHIANCVDPARITPSGKQSELRTRHGIAADAKIILYAHRFATEKQPLKAIEIANTLPENYVMVMAGNGQLYDNVKRLATNRIRLVGPIDSMADWLSIAHCFLSLSICEGYGLSVAEAAAAGVPVVSTPAGIAPQIGAQLIHHDAPAEQWVSAIVNALPTSPNTSLCNVDRFVDQWEEAIRATWKVCDKRH